MGCSKVLSIIRADGGDTPLDGAIFSAAGAAIYGVRGQYLYKFNATTGRKESEYRFVDDVYFSDASIVEVGGLLYIGVWRAGIEELGVATQNADIFQVPLAFGSSTRLGLASVAPGTFGLCGFTGLITDGVKIYGYWGPRAMDIFSVDPTNISTFDSDSFSVGEGFNINQMDVDISNGVLWATGGDVSQAYCREVDMNGIEEAGSFTYVATMLGVCVVPGAPPSVYYVTGSRAVLKANVAQAYAAAPFLSQFTVASTNLLQVTAKPIRIRYNPYDGLVYIPTGSGDTVEILNPATDTITAVKTGFTAPIDCVFTPTKKFAVQNSSVGLREIT